ncbi:MAG: alcohol dehydrogenase catalytic domain-containing protein [Thermoanaerobaculia bacterium]|nr:alcohol dehydrogenase catalytic domain-containing protein [Thermoanaerobaculia bacterium]
MQVVVSQPGPGIVLEERAEPSAEPGELVIRLLACGLCGTDLYKIARGSHAGTVLGHEVVGEVLSVGEGTRDFAVGDRVAAPHHLACGRCRLCRAGAETRCDLFRQDQLDPGGFSPQIRVAAAAVELSTRRLPPELPTEAAVFLEPAACVLRGIDRAGLDGLAIESLPLACLVLGAGSMGLLHVLLLRALFPDATIVVTEPDAWRRRQATRMGADRALAPRELGAALPELGDGRGFDAAFDTVGAPELIASTARHLRSGGTLVLFAHPKQGDLGTILETLFFEERRLVGTYSGALDEQQRVFDLLVEGDLDPRPLVTHHVPLTRFDEALRLSRDPRALKILLVPS